MVISSLLLHARQIPTVDQAYNKEDLTALWITRFSAASLTSEKVILDALAEPPKPQLVAVAPCHTIAKKSLALVF